MKWTKIFAPGLGGRQLYKTHENIHVTEFSYWMGRMKKNRGMPEFLDWVVRWIVVSPKGVIVGRVNNEASF